MKVYVAAHLLEQKVEDGVRFGLGHPDDATGESRVDVDTVPARDGVHADDGVDRLDGFAANVKSGCAGTVSLGYGAVERAQALQVGLQPRAEGRVQGIPTRERTSVGVVYLIDRLPRTPHGVTPVFRGGDDLEEVVARTSHRCARSSDLEKM